MQYLKEDGSLDISKLNKLPIEEFTNVFPTLTQEQKEEYWSKSPLNEGKMGTQSVYVDYTLEEDIERNGTVLADDLIYNLRNRRKNRK